MTDYSILYKYKTEHVHTVSIRPRRHQKTWIFNSVLSTQILERKAHGFEAKTQTWGWVLTWERLVTVGPGFVYKQCCFHIISVSNYKALSFSQSFMYMRHNFISLQWSLKKVSKLLMSTCISYLKKNPRKCIYDSWSTWLKKDSYWISW